LIRATPLRSSEALPNGARQAANQKNELSQNHPVTSQAGDCRSGKASLKKAGGILHRNRGYRRGNA
jgi:hypothetical protein